MKKTLSVLLAVLMLALVPLTLASCSGSNTIIVQTNAYFAPFEYYDGTEIVGVDVEIMNKVGEKLGKKVEFQNVGFEYIIDNVSDGKLCDVGAAGITVTTVRQEKVDFSIPYYTSVQYVIYAKDDAELATVDGKYIVWEALAGKTLGVQTDTTGMNFVEDEVAEGGVLAGTDTTVKNFESGQLAADAIIANQLDAVIIDKLPAEYIVDKNDSLVCLPLYSKGADGEADAPVEEAYAICVTKGKDDLLKAINEVLAEMLVKDENGESEIDRLIMKHMGME